MTPSAPLPVWLDGRLLSAAQARIDPADRGFLLGDGVFETMRVAGGRACHFARHMDRLAHGAAVLHMPPPDRATVAAGVQALLAACALVSGSLRLTLTRGTGPRGLLPPVDAVPTCLITATPATPPSTPVRLVTATHRRDEGSVLSRIKSLNYLPSILARMEAAAQEADDALLLNNAGHVAETSASTLVACLDGRPVTPPVHDGALPGTVRGVLVEAGLLAVGRIEVATLREACAIFTLNSLGAREVVALDGRAVPRRPDVLAALRACAYR
ncbi:aminotransferase class IV [Komagataeibacter sp. FNDCF1]|uniref:aminotransferase class IV n=1 Tax=Komagataeibacter sp. FNDCF1 TaxID=2878681 RepID=UPI001E34CAEE|nr:aminotransferase class IV [Komagataeibacter sp. FNDCF1]MCE2565326.1 aminotransferase class IV [Komagataeibacter sp. FNDCF1]